MQSVDFRCGMKDIYSLPLMLFDITVLPVRCMGTHPCFPATVQSINQSIKASNLFMGSGQVGDLLGGNGIAVLKELLLFSDANSFLMP